MFTRPAAISHKLDPTWLPINLDLSHQGNMKRFHDVAEQPQAVAWGLKRNVYTKVSGRSFVRV